MADIKVISWNPQGIQKNGARTQLKCDFLEKEYNNNNFDILTLQETHHKTEESFPQYINNLKISHNLFQTPASETDPYAGIVTLVHKDWKVVENKVLVEGRLLQVTIQKGKGKSYKVICVYAPPRKAVPGNYEKRLEILEQIEKAHSKTA